MLSSHKPNSPTDDRNDQTKRKKKAFLDLLLDESIKNNSLTVDDIRDEIDTFTFEVCTSASVDYLIICRYMNSQI